MLTSFYLKNKANDASSSISDFNNQRGDWKTMLVVFGP